MRTSLTFIIAFTASVAFCSPPAPLTTKDRKPGEKATPEQIDSYAGLGEARDAEQISFSRKLLAAIRNLGGTAMVSTWDWHGKQQFYVMSRNEDGSWSGPNMPMGYYTSSRSERTINYSKDDTKTIIGKR